MPRRKSHAYKFKYEGDFTSLNALTVLQTQINFVTILQEIKVHVYPEITLDIRIKGTEKGSLDINHLLEVTGVTGMFVLDNYKYITTVLTILKDLVRVKKFLKGEKAEKEKRLTDQKVEIHLHGDNIQIHPDAIKIYQDSPVISNAFNNTGRMLTENADVKYIELMDTTVNKKLLKIEQSEFNVLGSPNPYLIDKTDDQTYRNQIIFIKKPNLFPDNRKKWVWEFLHQGRDIKATMVDENFKRQINKGLRVGQGDRLKADLKVYYKFDERLSTFIESGKYEVSNILQIIPRTDETKFDF